MKVSLPRRRDGTPAPPVGAPSAEDEHEVVIEDLGERQRRKQRREMLSRFLGNDRTLRHCLIPLVCRMDHIRQSKRSSIPRCAAKERGRAPGIRPRGCSRGREGRTLEGSTTSACRTTSIEGETSQDVASEARSENQNRVAVSASRSHSHCRPRWKRAVAATRLDAEARTDLERGHHRRLETAAGGDAKLPEVAAHRSLLRDHRRPKVRKQIGARDPVARAPRRRCFRIRPAAASSPTAGGLGMAFQSRSPFAITRNRGSRSGAVVGAVLDGGVASSTAGVGGAAGEIAAEGTSEASSTALAMMSDTAAAIASQLSASNWRSVRAPRTSRVRLARQTSPGPSSTRAVAVMGVPVASGLVSVRCTASSTSSAVGQPAGASQVRTAGREAGKPPGPCCLRPRTRAAAIVDNLTAEWPIAAASWCREVDPFPSPRFLTTTFTRNSLTDGAEESTPR